MKFIIYKDQKKFTVDNVSIPDQSSLQDLINGEAAKEMTLNDLELYSVRITATRSIISDEETDNEKIQAEIDECINWYQETVN